MALRYETNGAHFDFPPYAGRPRTAYLIASSPRCGSNMLQRILWRTGVAGAPEEYLTEPYLQDFATRWSITNAKGDADLRRYIELLIQHRTSPNGVFGLKIHGSHLANPIVSKLDLECDLFSPKYIVMRRRNKYLQAVSYSKARQTGIWILDGAWLPDKMPTTETPDYSFQALAECLEGIAKEERTWDEYFGRHQIRPHIVTYEELVADANRVILDTLNYLGISAMATRIPEAGIKPQATPENDAWAARFADELTRARKLHDFAETQ